MTFKIGNYIYELPYEDFPKIFERYVEVNK